MSDPVKRLAKVPTNDESCVTFVLSGEGHTIGESLQKLIENQQGIEFCGYSVPHPLEKKINFRIQLKKSDDIATDSLRKGLDDFEEIFKHVQETFETAVAEFGKDVKVDT